MHVWRPRPAFGNLFLNSSGIHWIQEQNYDWKEVRTGLTIERLLSARSGARVLGSQIVHMNSELEDYSRNVNMLGREPKLQKHKWKPQLISEQLIAETVFQMWDPRRPDGVLNIFDGHIVWKEEGSKMDGWLVCLTPESRPRLQVWECSTLGACMKLKSWECWSATLAWPPSTSQALYHLKL